MDDIPLLVFDGSNIFEFPIESYSLVRSGVLIRIFEHRMERRVLGGIYRVRKRRAREGGEGLRLEI